jgi:hypothetical protein
MILILTQNTMSKVSDYELEQLENEDLAIPVQRMKKKNKIVREKKYPDKKKKRQKPQEWTDYESVEEDFD